MVWIAIALFGALVTFWSLLAPLGHSPDEPVHADLVDLMARGEAYPEFDGRQTSAGIINATIAYSPTFSGEPFTSQNADVRSSRPTLEEWGGTSPSSANQQPQHPPLYYVTTGLSLRVIRGLTPGPSQPLDQEWQWMRMLNVLIVLPLAALVVAAARVLKFSDATAVTGAVLASAIPQVHHIAGSINNDNLLILSCAVGSVLGARVLIGDTRLRIAAFLAVASVIAMLTKPLAAAFIVWVVGIYLYQAISAPDALKRRASLIAFSVWSSMTFLGGAWWYLRNVFRHGSPVPSILDPSFESAPEGFSVDLPWYGRTFVSAMVRRFWGDFGRWEAPMTLVLVIIATALATTCIVACFLPTGVQRLRTIRGQPSRRLVALFASQFVILLCVVFYRAASLYVSSGKTPAMQGRYLFSALVPFLLVVAAGLVRIAGRWAPVVALSAVVVMQFDAIRAGLRGWWGTPGSSFSESWQAMLAWAPWPPGVVYAVVVLIAALLVVGVIESARTPHDMSGHAADASNEAGSQNAGDAQAGVPFGR